MPLDLRAGPFTIEVPAGPLIFVAVDMNQRWVADIGLPGPDAGKGGKHLILPPDYKSKTPDGYYVWRSTTFRVIGGVRSLPIDGDVTKHSTVLRVFSSPSNTGAYQDRERAHRTSASCDIAQYHPPIPAENA